MATVNFPDGNKVRVADWDIQYVSILLQQGPMTLEQAAHLSSISLRKAEAAMFVLRQYDIVTLVGDRYSRIEELPQAA